MNLLILEIKKHFRKHNCKINDFSHYLLYDEKCKLESLIVKVDYIYKNGDKKLFEARFNLNDKYLILDESFNILYDGKKIERDFLNDGFEYKSEKWHVI